MQGVARSTAAAALLGLAALGCGGTKADRPAQRPHDRLGPCVERWNAQANFAHGQPGLLVRRLRPTPTVPLFAHVSLREHRRCVVFLDTPSTVDDRRFVERRGRYVLDCAGDCGQDVPPGARTFQFLRDGRLPRP